MNEIISVYINEQDLNEEEFGEAIRTIDETCKKYGFERKISNIYANMGSGRDDQIVLLMRELRDTLQEKYVCCCTGDLHNQISNINCDHMKKPEKRKMDVYEKYYLDKKKHAHGILVDENNNIVDGYITYLLMQKYGEKTKAYQVISGVPFRKVVWGRHYRKNGSLGKKRYCWIYDSKKPICPGDHVKLGKEKIYVERVGYVAGELAISELKRLTN